jgi:hypothetical protein
LESVEVELVAPASVVAVELAPWELATEDESFAVAATLPLLPVFVPSAREDSDIAFPTSESFKGIGIRVEYHSLALSFE